MSRTGTQFTERDVEVPGAVDCCGWRVDPLLSIGLKLIEFVLLLIHNKDVSGNIAGDRQARRLGEFKLFVKKTVGTGCILYQELLVGLINRSVGCNYHVDSKHAKRYRNSLLCLGDEEIPAVGELISLWWIGEGGDIGQPDGANKRWG